MTRREPPGTPRTTHRRHSAVARAACVAGMAGAFPLRRMPAIVLLSGLAAVCACGPSAGSPRTAQSGNVFVPGTPTPLPTIPLGSVPGGEIQGVLPRYHVGMGFDLVLSVQVSSPQKKTASKVLVRSTGGTFANQEFTTAFNSMLATVALKGSVEGVHQGEVSALYADGSQASPVPFQLQIGASTAPAEGGVSQATGEPAQRSDPSASQAGSQESGAAR